MQLSFLANGEHGCSTASDSPYLHGRHHGRGTYLLFLPFPSAECCLFCLLVLLPDKIFRSAGPVDWQRILALVFAIKNNTFSVIVKWKILFLAVGGALQEETTHAHSCITCVFYVQLYIKHAPKTCRNFLELSRKGYYNQVLFHRVIKVRNARI